MNIQLIKKKSLMFWLFLLAGIIFLLSITRHFLFEVSAESWFYYFEVISFFLLIVMLILAEKLYHNYNNQITRQKEKYQSEINELHEKNVSLTSKISLYEKTEFEAYELSEKQDKLLSRIINMGGSSNPSRSFLSLFSDATQAMSAILYTETQPSGNFIVQETYGIPEDYTPAPFSISEGLNGQVVAEGKPLVIEEIPEEYFNVQSGLGNSKPRFLYFLPVIKDKTCVALIELATFKKTDLEKMWHNISAKIIEKGLL